MKARMAELNAPNQHRIAQAKIHAQHSRNAVSE